MAKLTLYGEAAGQLLLAQSGVEACTDEERAMRIATIIHMNMGRGADQRIAVALVKAVAEQGLEAAARICTAKKSA